MLTFFRAVLRDGPRIACRPRIDARIVRVILYRRTPAKLLDLALLFVELFVNVTLVFMIHRKPMPAPWDL